MMFLGLFTEDLIREDDNVKEALRRMPQEVLDRRNFRFLQAQQLSIKKLVLPKEEWTTFETVNRY